jgi:ketosteroid isomerase-like protein
MNNRDLIEGFWTDLYKRDFDDLRKYLADDSEYTDACTPPDDIARGPAEITNRLRIGLEPLESISHDVRTIVCDGDTVVVEHVEHWAWPTGERVSFPFLSIHELRDGRIVRWWDYWDLGTLMAGAPAWWVEHIMNESARTGLRDA